NRGLLRPKGMITATGVMDDEQVYRLYARELTEYVTTLVGPFDAADVVTESCLRAFRSKGWPEVANRRAYLYRTMLSVANDHHRSTLSRRTRGMRAADRVQGARVETDAEALALLIPH